MTYSYFELELAMLLDAARGVRTPEHLHEQPYWKDIQRLKQLAYVEVSAPLAHGKTP